MSYKTILAIVGIPHGERSLRSAADICASTGAHLSVLIVKLAAPPPIGDYAAAVSVDWLDGRQRDMTRLQEAAEKATAVLEPIISSFDVTTMYTEVAWADDEIGGRARYADLTLVGDGLIEDPELRSRVIDGALFQSARPVLIIPKGKAATLAPKKVVLAWDSGFEAARAAREALDILAGADEVYVTMVDPSASYGRNGEEPGADVAGYLVRHGISVDVLRLPSEGRSICEVLNRYAQDASVDLIVMGAYGHSRMRERVFGGVTQSMLETATVPVLMAR
ncbi:universal stress protein [Ensifer sp. HO-A22]|uniref:Universal stress protein n=1 Tax=Ensifer oleiphilus TaxID=2742698 RepID=A0A7Y6Q6U1_9HYPH|nr:universal stress protein [Ensifer oleiphilus]NVD39925.1 universal stress protein [Ensifer oleiphilus]